MDHVQLISLTCINYHILIRTLALYICRAPFLTSTRKYGKEHNEVVRKYNYYLAIEQSPEHSSWCIHSFATYIKYVLLLGVHAIVFFYKCQTQFWIFDLPWFQNVVRRAISV